MFYLFLGVLATAIAAPGASRGIDEYQAHNAEWQNDFFDDDKSSIKIDKGRSDDMIKDDRKQWGDMKEAGIDTYEMSDVVDTDDTEYNGDNTDGSDEAPAGDEFSSLWPRPTTGFRHDCAVVVSLWKAFGKKTILFPGLVFRNGCCMGAPFFLLNDIPGVTCVNGHVTDIDWYKKGLVGPIPPAIKNLKNLKNLWLSYNQLSGSIPEEIGEMKSLEGLWLNDNHFTGNIPAGIASLESLVYLFINNNKLSGKIPKEIGKLVELQGLYLNNNDLSGDIPEELVSLKKLRYLYLNNNNFSGTLPQGITGLRDLKYLMTDPGL